MFLDSNLDVDRTWAVFEDVVEEIIQSNPVFQRCGTFGCLCASLILSTTVSQRQWKHVQSEQHSLELTARFLRCRDALIQLSELCQKLKRELRWEVVGNDGKQQAQPQPQLLAEAGGGPAAAQEQQLEQQQRVRC